MPKRLRVTRAKGYKLPVGAVVVTRASKVWGNPWRINDGCTREIAVAVYRAWLAGDLAYADTYPVGRYVYDRRIVLARLPELAGRDLACSCPLPQSGEIDVCHGAVLMELAAGSRP